MFEMDSKAEVDLSTISTSWEGDNDALGNLHSSSFDDEESYDECDEEPNPMETIVALCKSYHSIVGELSQKIKNEINQLKEKKRMLDKKAMDVETNTSKEKRPRKNWYHLFGSPYFKDKFYFPCPGNEDFYEKMSKNEINYHELQPAHKWKSSDQSKLEASVRNNLIEIKNKEFKSCKDSLLKKLKAPNLTTEDEETLKSELEALYVKQGEIHTWSIEKLVHHNTKDLDWLRISVVDFDGQRSSEEIQAMWELCLHPSICRKSWTDEENEKLEMIASKHNMEDWDEIAKELNTNRSGFQCFVQYQRNLNKNLRKSKWTDEEDDMLRKIIQETRVGDYIPWSKVALKMNGRTKVQVYNRWTYSIDPMIRKGRFTPEEDCLIVAGVQRYGKDFPRISRFLPGRTSIQIRDRFIGSLQKVGPVGKWTKEEDQLLIELVEKYGTKSWSKIVSHFSGRYKSQVRHRYLTLRRWMAKYPELSLPLSPSRYPSDYCSRQSNIWSQVRSILKSSLKNSEKFMEEKSQHFREESLLMLKKRLNMVNPRKCGRKAGSRKPLTNAEMRLMEHTKVSHILSRGRKKLNYDNESHQHRKHVVGLLLDLFKARLAFPFEQKVIEDDNTLDTADKFVLQSLKKIYDERRRKDQVFQPSSFGQGKANREWLPLHLPDIESKSPMDGGLLPPSVGTVLGLRTAMAAKSRLIEYRNTPKEKVIALPAWRPMTLHPGDSKEDISNANSQKLFFERLLILFLRTSTLKEVKPQIHGNVFAKNLESYNHKSTKIQRTLNTTPTKNCSHAKKKARSHTSSKRASEKQLASMKEGGEQSNINLTGELPIKKNKENINKGKNLMTKKVFQIPSRRSERLSKIQGAANQQT